jgi:hypothetical protein
MELVASIILMGVLPALYAGMRRSVHVNIRNLAIRVSIAIGMFLIGLWLSNHLIFFSLYAMGEGRGGKALYGYISIFDGVIVGTTCSRSDSQEKAIEDLHKYLHRAVRYIERGPKLDGKGNLIGERVLAITRSPYTGELMAEVVWTEGPVQCSITSRSLPHTLAFERAEESPEWLSRWLIR